MGSTIEKRENKTPIDLYASITGKFIEQLEKGIVPWQKPWTSAGTPVNIISKMPYQGINALILGSEGYEQNLFVTYKQLKSIEGRVLAGEKGHMLIHTQKTGENNGKDTFTVKHYFVFNVAQCKDIPAAYLSPESIPKITIAPQSIIENMTNCPPITHKEKNAFFNPKDDVINIPKKGSSKKDDSYYATLFHQLVHSTGHHDRLNRDSIAQMAEFGNDPYTLEELVAEIGACYLQSIAGIANETYPSTTQVQGWFAKLKADKFFIFKAAKTAQKAVNYILHTNETEEAHLE